MAISNFRQTRSFATLEISPAAFAEIRDKLKAAGYGHAFCDGGKLIDMHGIALVEEVSARADGNPAPWLTKPPSV